MFNRCCCTPPSREHWCWRASASNIRGRFGDRQTPAREARLQLIRCRRFRCRPGPGSQSGGERQRVPGSAGAQAGAEEAGGRSDEKAIPLPSKFAKKQPKPEATQHWQPKLIPENQLYSRFAPAAVSPMFEKPGSGGAGVGVNNAFGNQFGAYADLVVQRITNKWQTTGLAGLHLPMAVITFDILRDGSVKNAKVAQSSGNNTLDFSAIRAVTDAGPFPPLPPNYSGSQADVELRFQLQQ